MSITDDERTVLMIADRGEYMLAIGRWELPIKSLAKRGLLASQILNGGPQYTITEAGRTELNAAEHEEDQQLREIINRSSATLASIRGKAEQSAQLLAQAAKESEQATGDSPKVAAERWSEMILKRALDIIANG